MILSVEDLFQDDKLQPKTVAVTAAASAPQTQGTGQDCVQHA